MEWIKIKYSQHTHVHNASRQHIGPHGMPARCTLQFVRWCYGLCGLYGRFDSKSNRLNRTADSIRTQKTIRSSLIYIHTVTVFSVLLSGVDFLMTASLCKCGLPSLLRVPSCACNCIGVNS